MSAALQTPGSLFQVPEVSQAEIDSFHDAHFSHTAVQFFHAQFFRPENAQDDNQHYEEYEEYFEEDDGLGYYPDGVKRTLTDEQIAIFRHSELESLRRAQAKASKIKQKSAALLQEAKEEDAKEEEEEDAKLGTDPKSTSPPPIHDEGVINNDKDDGEVEDGSEDGEIEAEAPQLTKAEEKRIKRQRARRKKQEQRKFNPEKKPDLRKRTWDVVEAGMDSLDYDELEKAQEAAATPAAQRRRISYDD
ncbi:hypothetical protein F4820DRAFT_452975 [Hypoxylon rubiginosum]|uniref:Uncharacterized protein n=1 Tax=Hypoxylon rubiginosum TaxID=110542 RepID=A0ACB9YMI1_9PEZI|nr:hypothetical protein F4820DRAFT_452975 [Hypoxylon rubiginosum]